MADEENWSLISQPGRMLARDGSAGKRIVEEMVSGALEIMESAHSALVPRFAIGEHLLCEPDYRQILLWAEELGFTPVRVLEYLLRLPNDEQRPPVWKDDMRTLIGDGRLKRIALFRDWLPVDCARWLDGLGIESLAIWGGTEKLTCFAPEMPGLRCLGIIDQELNELVLSSVPALQTLECGENLISKLDLSTVPALQELWCCNNQLTELDLSTVPALQTLECGNNQLTELDLSSVPFLQVLGCWDNQLNKLDLSSVPALKNLSCSYNQLSGIDLSAVPALQTLDCCRNQLSELDLSANSALQTLRCWGNQLRELDLNSVPALQALECWDNPISELDITPTPNLKFLSCRKGQTRLIQRPEQNF